ncbi:MAG: DUF1549 domain-containing protein, partial [Planctomycetota bacterium]
WWSFPCMVYGQELEPTSQEMSALIDELLEERLKELGWKPADQSADAAFLRRVHLDLTGSPPTGSEVLAFERDESESKDKKLIDRLLGTAGCANHFAGQWSRWMLPEENNANPLLRRNGGLRAWLRERFAENLRYDRLVSDLLVATGPAQAGPAEFFVALEVKPEKIAAKTARVFMGVQLDCAECHDHPFDEWSQRDFWGFAAYFAQLGNEGEQSFMRQGEIRDTDEGDVTLPGTEEIVAPNPLVKTGFSGLTRGTRRQQLTLWLTARENPFLARATVNRVWAMLFGRGLIEPIDDMRTVDIASHPKILQELSDYFAATGYDLRNLVATLAKTKAYRRSTTHRSGHAPDDSYAVMSTKPLTEQQISDSITKVARQIVGDDNAAAQNLLARQLGQLRGDASEAKLGIVSALVTLHGDFFDRVSREESSRLLKALDAPFLDERKQLKWLFLSTLNRQPTQEEETAFSELFAQQEVKAPDVAETSDDSQTEEESPAKVSWQSDLLWALINSTEFAMTP